MIFYIIVIIGVFLCSASQLLLKKSTTEEHKIPIKAFFNWKVIVSYSIMFATLVVNIYCMKNGVMLKDVPVLEATGYIFVPILSYFVLKETITLGEIISIVLIILGIIVFYI